MKAKGNKKTQVQPKSTRRTPDKPLPKETQALLEYSAGVLKDKKGFEKKVKRWSSILREHSSMLSSQRQSQNAS